MEITDTKALGEAVYAARKRLGVTQRDLALAAGTGPRFIGDLERGKPTCRVGQVLDILQALGIRVCLEAR